MFFSIGSVTAALLLLSSSSTPSSFVVGFSSSSTTSSSSSFLTTPRSSRGSSSSYFPSSSSSSSSALSATTTAATTTKDVARLLKQHQPVIEALQKYGQRMNRPYEPQKIASNDDSNNDEDANDGNNDDASKDDDITFLRFAMAFETQREAMEAYKAAYKYRTNGRGKQIVEAAREAYDTACIGGGWDNTIVRDAAPHAKQINRYITPSNIMTTSSGAGDLVYVIRASAINDKQMMDRISVTQLSEFFMYVKEIHNLVANQRTRSTGRFTEVIFANDITGVRKPPDKRFSQALSESSSQYEQLYPSLAGPTLILNLPFILQACTLRPVNIIVIEIGIIICCCCCCCCCIVIKLNFFLSSSTNL